MTKLGKTVALILSAALAAVLIVSGCNRSRLKDRIEMLENNMLVLSDSVRTLETQNGDVLAWNQALMADNTAVKKELEEENLSKKEIESKLNAKIRSLTKTIAKFKADTIVVVDSIEILPDSSVRAPFAYEDEYTRLAGDCTVDLSAGTSSTTVSDLEVTVPLVLGITDKNQVFATSKNKNVSIDLLQTVELESTKCRQRRLGAGIYGGFGATYSLGTKTVEFGPQAGLGVYWRLF